MTVQPAGVKYHTGWFLVLFGSFLFRDGTRKSVLSGVRPINSLVTYPANPTGSLYFALDSQTFPLYN